MKFNLKIKFSTSRIIMYTWHNINSFFLSEIGQITSLTYKVIFLIEIIIQSKFNIIKKVMFT